MPATAATEPARLRAHEVLHFGRFTLVRSQRLLLEDGQPVRIGGRAFDVLLALAERPGETVSRRHLVAHAWPHAVVEDTALRASIAAVRRALRDDGQSSRFIDSVAGQGYSFVAPVRVEPTAAASTALARTVARPLPARLDRLVGRESSLAMLARASDERRLITVVGMGGVGKTALVLEAAELFASAYRHGVHFVDLSATPAGGSVAAAVAAGVGMPALADAAPTRLAAALADRQLLIVLDNCEHLMDSAAATVHGLLAHTESVRVLATSREPLRVPGEWVHRLEPLACPPPCQPLTPAAALHYAAVELFVERATGCDDRFALSADNLAGIAEICRRCDGLPLAIELAAARATFFGLQGLLAQWDDRFRLLQAAHRTAPPRHRSLQALLDSSHALLSAGEQATLRRVCAFSERFSLQAAVAVVSDAGLDPARAMLDLWALCSKSLVVAHGRDGQAEFGLLATVRDHGRAQLAAHGEALATMQRLAACVLEQLQAAVRGQRRTHEDSAALRAEAWRLVDWAFAQPGEHGTGVALTLATVPLGHPGLGMQAHAARIAHALAHVAAVPAADRPDAEARLLAAQHAMQAQAGLPHAAKAQARLRRLARQHTASGAGMQARFGLWVEAFGRGDYPQALALAEQLACTVMSSAGPAGELTVVRMLAQCHHFLGQHAKARALAEQVLARCTDGAALPLFGLQPVDMRVSMRIVLARIDWIEGRPLQARRTALQCRAIAEETMPQDRCQTLALALYPLAHWDGDTAAAQEALQALAAQAADAGLHYWSRWAAALRANDGMATMACSDALPPPDAKLADLLATLGNGEAAATALRRVQGGRVGWCAPEVLRMQALRLRNAGDPARHGEAQRLLRSAWALADRQGALAWQLRIALDAFTLCGESGSNATEAKAWLRAAAGAFEPTAATADLARAHALLGAA